MAYDYQAVLPSLAPASVSAFLLETVRTLKPDNEEAPLVEWLQALAEEPHAEALREEIRERAFANGYRPLVSLVILDEPGAKSIKDRTVFAPELLLTAGQFGLLIFLELQGDESHKRGRLFRGRGNFREHRCRCGSGGASMSTARLDRCQLDDCFFPSTNCGAGLYGCRSVFSLSGGTPVKV